MYVVWLSSVTNVVDVSAIATVWSTWSLAVTKFASPWYTALIVCDPVSSALVV